MAYIAPNWKNGAAPALDDAALQAISDAIVASESKNASQDSLIASLQSKLSSVENEQVQMASGTYTGNGLYGSYNNANRISLPFVPSFVFLYTASQGVVLILTGNPTAYVVGASNTRPFEIQWCQISSHPAAHDGSGDIAWYSTLDAARQGNTSGTTYVFRAFGKKEF